MKSLEATQPTQHSSLDPPGLERSGRAELNLRTRVGSLGAEEGHHDLGEGLFTLGTGLPSPALPPLGLSFPICSMVLPVPNLGSASPG